MIRLPVKSINSWLEWGIESAVDVSHSLDDHCKITILPGITKLAAKRHIQRHHDGKSTHYANRSNVGIPLKLGLRY